MSVLNLGGLIQWYLCEIIWENMVEFLQKQKISGSPYLCEIIWENMVEFLQKQKISGSQCTRQILIPVCVLNFFFFGVLHLRFLPNF
jgi:hypothetical protein